MTEPGQIELGNGNFLRLQHGVLSAKEAQDLYLACVTTRHGPRLTVRIGTKQGTMRRDMRFLTSDPRVPWYRFSQNMLLAEPVGPEVSAAMTKLDLTDDYNAVLVNVYRNPGDNIGAHSDDERSMKKGQPIHGLTVGRGAWFVVRSKTVRNIGWKVWLPHNSLVTMGGPTFQKQYTHAVPKSTKEQWTQGELTVDDPLAIRSLTRVSLTFRAFETVAENRKRKRE